MMKIQPYSECEGKVPIALGKELLLTAVNLKDKDCYCGSAVQDYIDPTTGVQWVVGGGQGTLTGGANGSPKHWTAPNSPVTAISLSLKVDDSNTAPNSTDDGGFLKVDSVYVTVLKPNEGSNTGGPYLACSELRSHGRGRYWSIRVDRKNCSVDFSGLAVNETGCTMFVDGCQMGFTMTTGSNAGPGTTINWENVAPDTNLTADCNYSNWTPSSTCVNINTCDWSIRAPSGTTYYDWSRWTYFATVPASTGIDGITYDRVWNTAL